MESEFSKTSSELEALRLDAEALRDELRGLKEANGQLAKLLSDQRDRLRNLLDRVKVEKEEAPALFHKKAA